MSGKSMLKEMEIPDLEKWDLTTGIYTIVDLRRCIHCNSCMKACEARHGKARLSHSGLQLNDKLILARVCIQCDTPVCIAECKLKGKGLAREDGITHVLDGCVGCGRCAKGCPYEGTEIVDIGLLRKRKNGILSRLTASKNGDTDAASDKTSGKAKRKAKRKANKCDLCREYKNPACIRECPTGAIRRVKLPDLLAMLDLISAEELLESLIPAGVLALGHTDSQTQEEACPEVS